MRADPGSKVLSDDSQDESKTRVEGVMGENVLLTDNVTEAVNVQPFQHLVFNIERYCPENGSGSELH